jgi:hypothetical protein
MPTAWELAQQRIAQQQQQQSQLENQQSAYNDLVNRIFAQQNGYTPSGQGYNISQLDPRYTRAQSMARDTLRESGEAPLLFPQQQQSNGNARLMPGNIPNAATITTPTRANLSPMVQAYQEYRNPWGQPTGPGAKARPQSELDQWAAMADTEGSPMERYLQWRDIYKPNNQGWQDKFQAQRERAAAIKAGLIGSWGELSGQRAGANAQVAAANTAANAQRYQADLAHRTAMEQAKMQYALAIGQGGGKK